MMSGPFPRSSEQRLRRHGRPSETLCAQTDSIKPSRELLSEQPQWWRFACVEVAKDRFWVWVVENVQTLSIWTTYISLYIHGIFFALPLRPADWSRFHAQSKYYPKNQCRDSDLAVKHSTVDILRLHPFDRVETNISGHQVREEVILHCTSVCMYIYLEVLYQYIERKFGKGCYMNCWGGFLHLIASPSSPLPLLEIPDGTPLFVFPAFPVPYLQSIHPRDIYFSVVSPFFCDPQTLPLGPHPIDFRRFSLPHRLSRALVWSRHWYKLNLADDGEVWDRKQDVGRRKCDHLWIFITSRMDRVPSLVFIIFQIGTLLCQSDVHNDLGIPQVPTLATPRSGSKVRCPWYYFYLFAREFVSLPSDVLIRRPT